MARWTVYAGDNTPTCTSCGIAAPYSRYSRKVGMDGHDITDYCPNCGKKMTAMDECGDCPHSDGEAWQDNGICFACRGDTWMPGKKQNERILNE